jgi:hypothetical protein
MDPYILGNVLLGVGATFFWASVIAYAGWGHWKETAVGRWYLFELLTTALALTAVLFIRAMPPEVARYAVLLAYGLFAVAGAGTFPTIVSAIIQERKRRRGE